MKLSRQQLVFVAAGLVLTVAAVVSSLQANPVVLAAGIVLTVLILWISEVAPLGVTALAIPIVATFTGILSWKDALIAWGDPIIFLFLGTFLLARALDKHGVLDDWAQGRWSVFLGRSGSLTLPLMIMLVAGAVSSMQNNTAVTAMFLPVVLRLARKQPQPALALLALAYGATFGGMATPVGTAPNFIGYRHMKELDAGMNFVAWLKVGIPVWLGTSLIAWAVLAVMNMIAPRCWPRKSDWVLESTPAGANSNASAALNSFDDDPAQAQAERRERSRWFNAEQLADVGPMREPYLESEDTRWSAGLWAQVAFLMTVLIWLTCGLVTGLYPADAPAVKWVSTYFPEALPPLLMAWLLFQIKVGPRRTPVLDRRDFQALDWDTLFLIAGGLCLGKVLDVSGADDALARSVAGLSQYPSVWLMLALAGVTVLLSELTSNTATAALIVPLAAPMAEPLGITPVQAVWLVALSASLGFALPVSTPPNALVYGTRKVPLGLMITSGLAVDLLCLIWVVMCIRWFA